MKHPPVAKQTHQHTRTFPLEICPPNWMNSASMSFQRMFAETGLAKINSSVRGCLCFMG